MSTAVLEKPSLMVLSLSELISEAIALGGEKVHDMAKAIGHVRHKKTWIAVIESIEIEPVIIGTETDIPFTEADEDDEADEADGDALVHLVYLNIPSDRTIAVAELSKKTNLPESELAHKLIQLELGKRVIEEPQGYYRRLAVDCPPPPPPPFIVRPCPDRQDVMPGIEIAKEEKCNDTGSDRRECSSYKKECMTCEETGLLDKNLTCINCNGKGWRTREEQLTINIRNICRTFVADLHDTCWGWQGNLQVNNWKEVMGEISSVRWGSCVGKDIWELARRIRDLYKYCDARKPNWGQLYPLVPAPLDRIDENHWLLMLIFFEGGQDFEDGDYSAINNYHIPRDKYDKWKVLGKVELFLLPNEIQEDNVIDSHYVEDYLVLRGAGNE